MEVFIVRGPDEIMWGPVASEEKQIWVKAEHSAFRVGERRR